MNIEWWHIGTLFIITGVFYNLLFFHYDLKGGEEIMMVFFFVGTFIIGTELFKKWLK